MKKLGFILLLAPLLSYSQCWQSVSAGYHFTIAKKTDGTLWGMGQNSSGQLGDGTTTDKYTITQIGNDDDWNIISSGGDSAMAIKNNGTLWGWGGNGGIGAIGAGTSFIEPFPIQIGTDSNWETLDYGGGHGIALKTNGTLWGWGYNNKGQVGNGTNTDALIPVQIGTDSNWQKVMAGRRQSLAIKTDGTLWAWGENEHGELGDGTFINRNAPVQIGTNTDWESLSTLGNHSLAIKTNGTLWSWGDNAMGQIGDGTQTSKNYPVQIGTGTDWQEVSAGGIHSLALKTNGTVWGWGDNNYYFQLGFFSFNDQLVPIQLGTSNEWIGISGGGVHTAMVKSDNTLWVFGWNYLGQLGNGTNTGNYPQHNAQNTPIAVNCAPLGTGEEQISQFEIYPNPVKSKLNIHNSENISIKQLQIVNVFGQIVHQTSYIDLIDISSFPIGIYFLKIFDEQDNFYSVKFLKQ
jgi:alpha-tubulin suppressor-like RCC1 family protein